MYYDPAATGERIQNLRKDREVTQEQLAIDLNISDRYMRNQGNGCRNHRLGKNAKGRNSCCSCRIAEAKAGTSAPKSRNRFFKTNTF